MSHHLSVIQMIPAGLVRSGLGLLATSLALIVGLFMPPPTYRPGAGDHIYQSH